MYISVTFCVFVFQYFYSVKDISIGGRCVCNGHAEVCDKTDPFDQYRLLCRCRHNTCGPQCNTCCPGFVQKPWKPATLADANECERKYAEVGYGGAWWVEGDGI